ncbi:hypothetical protein [Campylobacter sputorum]|uniref:hypothetical protein n=1 Tax=Campylobacter sputorum TaxID=206 RepID=UPI001E491199|nr:hypothetical protein [Campylobacter sputorum]
MEFEYILYSKDSEIEECNKIVEHIKNCCKDYYKSKSNSYILIKLLSDKIDILKNLKHDNYDKILLKLKTINEQIYKQIKIFKQKVFRDFKTKDKNYLLSKYNISNIFQIVSNISNEEYYFYFRHKDNLKNHNIEKTYDKFEYLEKIKSYILDDEFLNKYMDKKSQKAKKEVFLATFNFIKKHQWISTVLFFGLGFIIYFFYFFKKGIPFVSGQEFIYITTATSTIFLLIPVIILLIVIIFYYLYITEKKEGKFNERWWLFYKSIFVDSLSLILMAITFLVFPDTVSEFIVGSNLEIGLSEVFELLGAIIIAFLLFALLLWLSIKNEIMLFLCTIILPTFFLFIISIKIGNLNSFFASFLIFFGAMFFIYCFLIKAKKQVFIYLF